MFRFEAHDVPVPAIQWIGERCDQKRGGWVFGRIGTGKSHAARKAVPGALHVDVSPGPLLGQRFVADLARQVGAEGRRLLETFRNEGIGASLRVAEHVVNGHPFIVDGIDALLPLPSNLDDPVSTLWQSEKDALLDWLRGRLEGSPTFLIGRRHPQGIEALFPHEAPDEWPIRLKEAPGGYRRWPELGELAHDNPAVLTLARALVPLLPAWAFNDLVEQAAEDGARGLGLLQRLGQAFQSSAPPSWQKVLALVGALGASPREAIVRVFGGRADTIPGTRDPEPLAEEQTTVDRLRELRLIEERSGVLSLLPALRDAGAIRELTANEWELLPAMAHALLAEINDPRSLAPEEADRVLRAHAIFVEIGNMSMAERTAALHAHGLVDLARRTSRDKRHSEAWRQYDAVLRMLQSGTWSTDDPIGRRLVSYVRHYRARDGALAGMLDDATCLAEYGKALEDWPENALWHQRYIESFIRLGRPIEATKAVDRAEELVAEHPRRDELLRVRPAGVALQSGLPLLSLALIEDVLDLPVDLHPEVVDGCRMLVRRWEHGIDVHELPFPLERGDAEGCVVFHAEVELVVRRAGDIWAARLEGFASEMRAKRPIEAIEALARQLAGETRRLVSTPVSNLGEKDVRLQGSILSIVDVLNSDIGLEYSAERWIVGRIHGNVLVPTMRHLPEVAVPGALLPESTEGLYLALVPVHRDGVPSGPATQIVPAGSGRDTGALLELLIRMSENTP